MLRGVGVIQGDGICLDVLKVSRGLGGMGWGMGCDGVGRGVMVWGGVIEFLRVGEGADRRNQFSTGVCAIT